MVTGCTQGLTAREGLMMTDFLMRHRGVADRCEGTGKVPMLGRQLVSLLVKVDPGLIKG